MRCNYFISHQTDCKFYGNKKKKIVQIPYNTSQEQQHDKGEEEDCNHFFLFSIIFLSFFFVFNVSIGVIRNLFLFFFLRSTIRILHGLLHIQVKEKYVYGEHHEKKRISLRLET